MKTSNTWNFGSIVGKIMMGLVLASMIGSIDVASALAEDNRTEKHVNAKDNRTEKHNNGGNQQKGRVDRYGYGGAFYFPKPPPIIYVPPSAPGIGIFFPPVDFTNYSIFKDSY